MTQKTSNLPEYARPPVTEVVIGVQFNTIEAFTAVHPGLYWQRVRNSYPKVNVQPPLSPVLELFGDEKPKVEAKLSSIPPLPRCWFLDDSQNRLVQIQPDRFLHNWKKVTGQEEYPRYETIREDFKKLWNDFSKFLEDEQLGQVKTNQWELTYVNYIHQNDGWISMNDLTNLFPCWSGKSSEGYLPVPENITFNVTYAFPEKLGRLHISLEPCVKMPEGSPLLRLTLTARGRLESSDTESILRSLDIGHEWIVRGFTDFTTNKAHKIWKRKELSKNA
jgi:uncharacterized protein (TIGR04255 family)